MIGSYLKSISVLLFFLSGSVFSQPQISVALDKTDISIGETIQLFFTVVDFGTVRPEISMPDLTVSFDVLGQPESTSVQMINGKVSSYYQQRLILRSREIGSFILGPFSVTIDDEYYEYPSVGLVVNKATAIDLGSESVSSDSIEIVKPPIFVETSLSTGSVFVGESIVLRATLYTRHNLSNIAHEFPEMEGVWMENLNEQPVFTEKIGGQLYRGKHVYQRAIYPLREGEIIIPVARIGYVKNFFEGQQVLETDPLLFHVKPLPEVGRPSLFSGVVGDYQMKFLSEGPDLYEMVQNVPVTLRFEVSGAGYLGGVKELSVSNSNDFTVYPSKIEDSVNREGGIQWTRVFEYLLVPKTIGQIEVPVFSLSYFSPSENIYKVLNTESWVATVNVGLNGTDSVAVNNDFEQETFDDFAYLRLISDVGGFSYSQRLLIPFCLLCLTLIVTGGAFIRRVSFTMSLKENGEIIKNSVTQLKVMIKSPCSSKVVLDVLYDVLSYRLDHTVMGLSLDELEKLMLRKEMSIQLVKKWSYVLSELMALGYQPDSSHLISEDLKRVVLELLDD